MSIASLLLDPFAMHQDLWLESQVNERAGKGYDNKGLSPNHGHVWPDLAALVQTQMAVDHLIGNSDNETLLKI